MAVHFYTGAQFPARYRGGAFVTFHGSWNRAPLPQAGYKVAFVPAADGRLGRDHEVFADGFAGSATLRNPSAAVHRPVGLAQTPDGGLLVSDDARGRIWKIVYTGTR
jgi:glucose/arabinose dehydrogenase